MVDSSNADLGAHPHGDNREQAALLELLVLELPTYPTKHCLE